MADLVTGTVTLTLTGCTTSPTVNATYIKSLSTGLIVLRIPAISAISNTTGCGLTGLSSGLVSSGGSQNCLCFLMNNGVSGLLGFGAVTGAGSINFSLSNVVAAPGAVTFSAAGFTNSGNKGVSGSELTYIGPTGPP